MFKKFFQALARLVNNTNSLADTMGEADALMREKMGLPARDEDNNSGRELEYRDGKELPQRKLLREKDANE